jgi:hypothetical protein
VEVYEKQTRKLHRVVTVTSDIFGACCHASARHGHRFDGFWVRLKDRRQLVYNAMTGHLVEEIPVFAKDSLLRAMLREDGKEWNSQTRYTLVIAITKTCHQFYDFSNDRLVVDAVPDVAMVKSRAIAVAAAKILTRERKEKARYEFPLDKEDAMPQVVAVRKTANGCKFLEKVRCDGESYIPVLHPANPPKIGPA